MSDAIDPLNYRPRAPRDPNPYTDIPTTVHTLTIGITRLHLLTAGTLDQLHHQADQHDSYPTTASGRDKNQGGTAELTAVEAAAHRRLGDLNGDRPGPVTQTWHLYDYVICARDALNLAIQALRTQPTCRAHPRREEGDAMHRRRHPRRRHLHRLRHPRRTLRPAPHRPPTGPASGTVGQRTTTPTARGDMMREYRCPHCHTVLDDVEMVQVQNISTSAAFGKRQRHELTEEFLSEVLAIYGARGVPGVMERFSTSERNVWRWLAHARNGNGADTTSR